MAGEPIRFESLIPGRSFGSASFPCTGEVLERWQAIYPELNPPADSTMPPGLSAVIYMDAYSRLVTPRPEGNVHATQRFRWRRLARVGEMLSTRVAVKATEVRDGRKRATFSSTTTGEGGDVVLEGEMVVLWGGA